MLGRIYFDVVVLAIVVVVVVVVVVVEVVVVVVVVVAGVEVRAVFIVTPFSDLFATFSVFMIGIGSSLQLNKQMLYRLN